MRLLKKIAVGRACGVKIYRKPETDEYVVQTTVGKKVQGGKRDGGYFTDDLKDARSTAAAAEIRRLRRQPSCR